tara:strand:+ start:1921 stop:2544 length:624 start_codon:yes stop_codon:yes gene_type:complete
MDPEAWVALGAAFILGAASPGPSLAVVLRNTMVGGRTRGVATGAGHGFGFGLYAFAMAYVVTNALALHDSTVDILRWGGILLLLWLGYSFIKHSRTGPYEFADESGHGAESRAGFSQGFGIAFFNSKILSWHIAIMAPIIEPGMTIEIVAKIGLLGLVIDSSWYISVVLLLTRGDGISKLRSIAHRIDLGMGLLMLFFAFALLGGYL